MQITVKIPDKLAKKFNKTEREKIIKEAFKEKIEKKVSLKDELFFKWVLEQKESGIETKNDVAEHHDKYLYGGKD